MSLEKARENRARIRTRAFDDAMLYVQTGDDTRVRPLNPGKTHAAHPVYLPVLPRMGDEMSGRGEEQSGAPSYTGEGAEQRYRRHRITAREFENDGQRGWVVTVRNNRGEIVGQRLVGDRERAMAWGRDRADRNVRVRVRPDDTRARQIGNRYRMEDHPSEEAAELARRREWISQAEPRLREEQRERARLTGRLRRTQTYREMDPNTRRAYQRRIRDMDNQELHELNMGVRQLEQSRRERRSDEAEIAADRARQARQMRVGVPYSRSRMVDPLESAERGRPVTYTRDVSDEDRQEMIQRRVEQTAEHNRRRRQRRDD